MVTVFVRHEFCLCGICYLPALSSTSLPPLETYLSESQASPLSDLWLTSVHAESLSYRVPSLHPSVHSITAMSSIAGLQPNPLLSHLSQPLAPAMLNSLLVSEITHHLLSQSHQFFIDLLLDLWSLSQQLGHYSGMQGLGSFPRATASGFVL